MKLDDIAKLNAALKLKKLKPRTRKVILAFLAANADDAPAQNPNTRIALLPANRRRDAIVAVQGLQSADAARRARARAAVDALDGFEDEVAQLDLTNFQPIDSIPGI